MMTGRQGLFILILLLGLSLMGCGGETAAAQPAQAQPVALEIECHTAYRSSVTVGIEREEMVRLSEQQPEQSLSFTELEFHALYTGGLDPGEPPGLKTWVTLAGDEAELNAQLYQFGGSAVPANQFSGGHGFTGLHYSYHPTSGAELQYWCLAGP